ncbi:MAG: hypothetical protein A3D67_02565 [Candidatus Lloydbacteria bacterium RIFCSPHIGHO2_02_FULL_51_22]|uniref:PPM-type phosphatase domain-containing protein n=2 Tax=Candidatus Lloydiibacteriota TaxID=1817910 RepID=A0A1G2D7L5_9BACT|nr:MAG: hypothetical protein A3D67_02565 [Candidatus Lloydbacteria bacterium RIFCSPHIGHO2_02_FULL_51_22]OGZ14773.1 MAG: hypothetical protein A3J08_04330 [Candidatus Lloydbacteria bacterium RIFCSPLOWO2_02_FULL_51_11]
MQGFRIAGGSVPGTAHTKPGQPGWVNNQDAFVWHTEKGYLVAVVCDGCSSAPHSEVGAKIGAQLFSRTLSRNISFTGTTSLVTDDLRVTQKHVGDDIVSLAKRMSEGRIEKEYQQILADYFLFTIIGVVITPDETTVFSLGDGVHAINERVEVIAPYENNAPPYLVYAHMPAVTYPGSLDVHIRMTVPTKDVQSVLIGTDGVADFVAAATSPLPGKTEVLGPLSQFWTDDKFVGNPDAIRRRLAIANREWVESGHIKKGLLPDDTTLVVIRRESQPEK